MLQTSAYFRGASASTVKWVLAEPDPDSMLGYRPDDGLPIPAKFLCSSCFQEGVGIRKSIYRIWIPFLEMESKSNEILSKHFFRSNF